MHVEHANRRTVFFLLTSVYNTTYKKALMLIVKTFMVITGGMERMKKTGFNSATKQFHLEKTHLHKTAFHKTKPKLQKATEKSRKKEEEKMFY